MSKEYMIYVGVEGGIRRASGPVREEDLENRLATVRNCFADAPVHITRIKEVPYTSYLPKCAESGNCIPLTDADVRERLGYDDIEGTMHTCIG